MTPSPDRGLIVNVDNKCGPFGILMKTSGAYIDETLSCGLRADWTLSLTISIFLLL
jgi:hypothetical protein